MLGMVNISEAFALSFREGIFHKLSKHVMDVTLQGINISHLGKRKENHLQNAIFGGYVSFLEGKSFRDNPAFTCRIPLVSSNLHGENGKEGT